MYENVRDIITQEDSQMNDDFIWLEAIERWTVCMTFSSDSMDTTTDQDNISEAKETKFLHGCSQVEEDTSISRITLHLLSRHPKIE